MNNLNLSEEKQNALLQMAAKQLGKNPEEIKKMAESGQFDSLLQNMDINSKNQIGSLLNNPVALKLLLSNPKILQMLGNIGN